MPPAKRDPLQIAVWIITIATALIAVGNNVFGKVSKEEYDRKMAEHDRQLQERALVDAGMAQQIAVWIQQIGDLKVLLEKQQSRKDAQDEKWEGKLAEIKNALASNDFLLKRVLIEGRIPADNTKPNILNH